MAGIAETTIGFRGMNMAVGFINVIYAPCLLYLRGSHRWSPNKSDQIGLLEDDDMDMIVEFWAKNCQIFKKSFTKYKTIFYQLIRLQIKRMEQIIMLVKIG